MKSSEITNPLDNAFSHPQLSLHLSSLIIVPVIYFFFFFFCRLLKFNITLTAKLSEIRVEPKELVLIGFSSYFQLFVYISVYIYCNQSLPHIHVIRTYLFLTAYNLKPRATHILSHIIQYRH